MSPHCHTLEGSDLWDWLLPLVCNGAVKYVLGTELLWSQVAVFSSYSMYIVKNVNSLFHEPIDIKGAYPSVLSFHDFPMLAEVYSN